MAEETTTISPALRAYLQSWLDWVEMGAVGGAYDRWAGLCSGAPPHLQEELYEALGRAVYPFGERNFRHRHLFNTQHEDPARLAWVRGKLGVGNG